MYRVCVFGDRKGKTTYLNSLANGKFMDCDVTVNREVMLLSFKVEDRNMDFQVLDIPSDYQTKYLGVPERPVDAAIYFFKDDKCWLNEGNVHVVKVWGSCDKYPMPDWCYKDDIIPHSTKTKVNYLEPFQRIIQQLTHNPNITLKDRHPQGHRGGSPRPVD